MRYNNYADLNLSWIHTIPSHWHIAKNRLLLHETNYKTETGNEDLLMVSQYTGISRKERAYSSIGMRFAESQVGYKLVHVNDIVMNIMLAWNGSTGASKYNGIVSPAYSVFQCHECINPWYIHYLFRTPALTRFFKANSTGIIESRLRLYPDVLLRLYSIVPPRAEQDQIVRYLDWQVSKINKLIAAKKKQIATVKVALQADIEAKLSAHSTARIVRLKSLGQFSKGGGFSRDNLVEDTSYPAILYGDIYTQYTYKTDVTTHFIDEAAYNSSRKISKGDIVLAGTGETKDEIGKPILYSGDEIVAVGGDVIVFHPHNEVNSEYVLYQLYSQASLFHRYTNGKGDIIVHISPATLGNTVLELPSMEEQKAAVENIELAIKRIYSAVKAINDEIDVLHEYRTRLISDVVTGQIDVRNIEVPDFEMVEEIDTDDALDEDESSEGAEEQEEG